MFIFIISIQRELSEEYNQLFQKSKDSDKSIDLL